MEPPARGKARAKRSLGVCNVMQPQTHLRTRPISVGQLRTFEAVARHLNFRAAADELSLTQSAISRQIQGLEDEVGVPLFLRHTRAVELTSAGAQLLRTVVPGLERIDSTVRLIRQTSGRKSVAITTWASFASMWLIPRLEAFQHNHPDIDIRIDATDNSVDLDTADVDLALRYAMPASVTRGAERLFGEQLTVVASPWLLKSGARLDRVADVANFTLIEAGDEDMASIGSDVADPSSPESSYDRTPLRPLLSLFEAGRHLAVFRDAADLREKIGYYLANPEARNAIARAGQAEVLERHTYLDRMRTVLQSAAGAER